MIPKMGHSCMVRAGTLLIKRCKKNGCYKDEIDPNMGIAQEVMYGRESVAVRGHVARLGRSGTWRGAQAVATWRRELHTESVTEFAN